MITDDHDKSFRPTNSWTWSCSLNNLPKMRVHGIGLMNWIAKIILVKKSMNLSQPYPSFLFSSRTRCWAKRQRRLNRWSRTCRGLRVCSPQQKKSSAMRKRKTWTWRDTTFSWIRKNSRFVFNYRTLGIWNLEHFSINPKHYYYYYPKRFWVYALILSFF